MSTHWNYRVVKCPITANYFITEVFYNEDGEPDGYIGDNTSGLLSWPEYTQLKSAADRVMAAFSKPVLEVDKAGKLVER